MNRFLLFCAFVACLLQGCKQNTSAENDGEMDSSDSVEMVDEDPMEDETDELISEEPMPQAAEEFFDDFFFNFASNKRLQKERVSFPLLVYSNAKTDTLERKDWHTDHFFMHQEEYTLIFDSEEQMNQVKDVPVEEVVVEKIFLSQAFVHQYVFRKKNGQWRLDEIHKQTLSLNPNASFLAFYRRAFAPELPRDTIYNIVYGKRHNSPDEKIFVIRGISNGQEVTMTFHHQHDKWKLTKLTE